MPITIPVIPPKRTPPPGQSHPRERVHTRRPGITIPGPQYTPNISLFTSILQGRSFVMDLTKIALAWQRKIRLQGGYWQATFRVEAPLATLMDYFYTWLGMHIEESVLGARSWEGMIYEMTLNTPNASRMKSLDNVYNHVRVKYNDGADKITAAVLTQASIDKYGRREAIEESVRIRRGAIGERAGIETYR